MGDGTCLAGQPQTSCLQAAEPTAEELSRQVGIVQKAALLRETLAAMPIMVVILNYGRQIVAANQAALDTLRTVQDDIIQKRPGEVVGCIRARQPVGLRHRSALRCLRRPASHPGQPDGG